MTTSDPSAYRQGILGDDDECWNALEVLDRARMRFYARTETFVRLGRMPAIVRAERYLNRIAPCVSGERGRPSFFGAVAAMVRGFMLHPDEAIPLLASWNERNAPPFSAAELESTAWRAHRGEGNLRGKYPLGYLLHAGRR